jgi:hypothetical protein
VLDEPDQLGGGTVRDGGNAVVHDGERGLIGDELVIHAPFGRGLPAGRLSSGRQIPAHEGNP